MCGTSFLEVLSLVWLRGSRVRRHAPALGQQFGLAVFRKNETKRLAAQTLDLSQQLLLLSASHLPQKPRMARLGCSSTLHKRRSPVPWQCLDRFSSAFWAALLALLLAALVSFPVGTAQLALQDMVKDLEGEAKRGPGRARPSPHPSPRPFSQHGHPLLHHHTLSLSLSVPTCCFLAPPQAMHVCAPLHLPPPARFPNVAIPSFITTLS
eukprot:CAMPEP_0177594280 /NCGR_PEP_ID=MMETSP0419_2-20121207/9697_1 /TAXON_ID=582737 /ORGANISM="Tetraselmis sp., Strain GSL018" /LENGTH=208 /DNA_ID=CAMNT_0019085579 /DNA_START=635 /DNA_END=1256 /DNA_ORIENTATION=-